MKVLVTGGKGFIGSHVVQALQESKIQPISFDKRGPTDFQGDVRDYTDVLQAVAISDGVIHLAGVLGTQETIREPLPAVETNIYGSLNVFKACQHYNKKCVYIAVGNHWMNNSYSITKTTAERFAFMFNKELGTKIAVVRGLNAYGPGQKDKPVRKIIPNFILPMLKRGKVTIYGDGSQVMDMIYVKDLAAILINALLMDHGVYDRPFEAGTGRHTTVKEIAFAVVNAVKKYTLPKEYSIEYVPMRPGETEHSVVVADPKMLLPLARVENLTSLEVGLAETVKWYQSQYQSTQSTTK